MFSRTKEQQIAGVDLKSSLSVQRVDLIIYRGSARAALALKPKINTVSSVMQSDRRRLEARARVKDFEAGFRKNSPSLPSGLYLELSNRLPSRLVRRLRPSKPQSHHQVNYFRPSNENKRKV